MYLPASDILYGPEVEGAHCYDEYVAKRLVVVEQAKEHVEEEGQELEQQVEEADGRVCRVLDELRQVLLECCEFLLGLGLHVLLLRGS